MNTKLNIYKSLLNDAVFKYIFGYSKNVLYTEYLLELLFNMQIGSLKDKVEIINSFTLEKTSFDERGLEVDIKVKMPSGYLNLEAYTTFKLTSRLKSTMYLSHMFATELESGEDINKTKPHLQINFIKSKNIKSKIYSIISEDEEHEYFIGNYFRIRVINVDEYKDICYNNLDKLGKLLKFMSAENDMQELAIIKGDEILENIYNDKQKFLQSKWASTFFTHENYLKSLHKAEIAEKDEIIEEKDEIIKELLEKNQKYQATIKNLAKHNFSLQEISTITNLDIKDIQNILNN